MVSLPLPLHLAQHFFDSGLEGRAVQGRRRGLATELMHPKIRRGRLLIPLALCAVQEIDVPGYPLRAEHFLPLLTGEPVAVPVIAHALVIEFVRAGFGPISGVTGEHRKPDDVNPQPVIRNIIERLLYIGEPPTASRSNRGEKRHYTQLAAIALEGLFERIEVTQVGHPRRLPSLACRQRATSPLNEEQGDQENDRRSAKDKPLSFHFASFIKRFTAWVTSPRQQAPDGFLSSHAHIRSLMSAAMR